MIRSLDELAELAPAWDDLFRSCSDAVTTFQSFAWTFHCGTMLVRDGVVGERDLRIHLAWRGERLVAALPLMLRRTPGCRVLNWIGGPLTPYGDVLAAPGEDVAAWAREVVGEIRTSRDADTLVLGGVRGDALIAPFLAGAARELAADHAPYLDMSDTGFAAWHEGLSRNTRKSLRRNQRKLAARGDVSFRYTAEAAEVAAAVDRLLALKRDWAAAKAVLSRTIGNRSFEQLVAAVAASEGVAPRVSTLALDGRAIAIELGFVEGRRYRSYLGAYDPAFADYGPGVLQLERTLEACFDDGIATFDLMPPGDDYKTAWADRCATTRTFGIPFTVAGRLHGALVRHDLVGTAKRAMARLPSVARQALRWVLSGGSGRLPAVLWLMTLG